ncbi:hypothetical protein I6I78_09695 [Enterococcus casseliflavus]|uniref:hypothetical protein n=1 Tax=Enterococcus casseliflavus TaxID=37734 RepID=UPI0019192282|nr:hypothetical protein [Enterococcus casseliflavus]QQU18524.1 hypothetical protein I6I78_09695 [Enterococcus casseliflavus]
MPVIKTSTKGIEQQLYSLYHIVFLKHEKFDLQIKKTIQACSLGKESGLRTFEIKKQKKPESSVKRSMQMV